jgi:hypothetical protein
VPNCRARTVTTPSQADLAAGQAGLALGHPRLGTARRPGPQYYDSESESNHGLTGTGSPGNRGTARRDWQPSHCTGRTRLGLGLRRVGETPSESAQAGRRPSRTRDPGRARSDGTMTVSDSSILERSLARPADSASRRINIANKYRRKYRGNTSSIIAGRAGLSRGFFCGPTISTLCADKYRRKYQNKY